MGVVGQCLPGQEDENFIKKAGMPNYKGTKEDGRRANDDGTEAQGMQQRLVPDDAHQRRGGEDQRGLPGC